jgi:hypothetical protein
MRRIVPCLLIVAAIGCIVSLVAFLMALFPWSLMILGLPIFINVCRSISKDR